MIYFSAKTRGFYPTGIVSKEWYEENNSWPEDAVEVTHSDYEQYISTPPEGKMLGSENGFPVWVKKSPLDKTVLIQIATMKKQELMENAEQIISLLERAVKLNMATDTEKKQLEVWLRYSVLLNRINPNDEPGIIWPELPV